MAFPVDLERLTRERLEEARRWLDCDLPAAVVAALVTEGLQIEVAELDDLCETWAKEYAELLREATPPGISSAFMFKAAIAASLSTGIVATIRALRDCEFEAAAESG